MADFSNMANKQETPKVGVGVVLRNHDDKVLLGKRKGSHGAGQWSLPGGHIDIGESFSQCCTREVKEETDIDIDGVGKIDFVNSIMEDEGLHYVTLYFYAHDLIDQKPIRVERDKCEDWQWFSFSDVVATPVSHLFESTKEIILKFYSNKILKELESK